MVCDILQKTFEGEVFYRFLSFFINVKADCLLRHTLMGDPLCITISCVCETLIGIANKFSLNTIGRAPGLASRM